jgi:cytochrome b
MPETKHEATTTVWDPIVRYGHWALVAVFAITYLSAEEDAAEPNVVHVWGGYLIGLIVVLRMLWGLIGPRHARFTDFIYGPYATLRYIFNLVRGRARRYVGHSPAGGAMVIALLICLAGTVGTGFATYHERGIITAGSVDTEAGEHPSDVGEGSSLGGVHAALANITLALIVLHILGVGLASLVHRENLIAAMMHGRKRRNR